MKNLKTAEKVRKQQVPIVRVPVHALKVECNRCGDETSAVDGGNCFFCGRILCWDCFEQFGQCGHEKSEK